MQQPFANAHNWPPFVGKGRQQHKSKVAASADRQGACGVCALRALVFVRSLSRMMLLENRGDFETSLITLS